MARLATLLVLVLASTAAAAQSDEQALAAEQRALDAERRAVAAERRAVEAERRAFEADRNASSGSSRAPSDIQAQACQAATANYQIACSVPSRDPLWETPQCTIAEAEVRKRCYAGQ
jgi:hypothetical protein